MNQAFTKSVEFAHRRQDMDYWRLPEFGADSSFDAAHVTDSNGHIVAIFIEPQARQDRDPSFDEDSFHAEIEAEVKAWDRDAWEWLQFDPGRDQATEIRNPAVA